MENIIQTFIDTIAIVQQNMASVLLLLGILWAIQIVNYLVHYKLNILGIYPRSWHGLIGIFFAPFLHGHFTHLFFNSIPLFILATFVMINGLHVFIVISVIIIILSGFGTWLFGRRALHIGASSVIMGYMGYLLMNAYYQGTGVAIAIGIVSIYYFGGLLFSLVPSDVKVSWEGHLFGFIAGIATALLLPFIMPMLVFA